MIINTKLKLDEELISHLVAWPRFIIGASVVVTIALTLFTTSVLVGYSLKAVHYLQSHQRRTLRGHSPGVSNSR